MIMNSGSLPQNKPPFSRIYLQNFYFCTKIRSNDPSTFVVNEWYHLEEGVEMNGLRPKIGSESGRRTAFEPVSLRLPHVPTIAANSSISRRAELALATSTSTSFGPATLMRAGRRAIVLLDRPL